MIFVVLTIISCCSSFVEQTSLKYWYACTAVTLVTCASSLASVTGYSHTHQFSRINHFCRVILDFEKKLLPLCADDVITEMVTSYVACNCRL